MLASKDVWVFAEHREGEIQEVVLELLSEGRRLARQLGEEVCAVLLGHEVEGLVQPLVHYGAQRVYLVDNQHLAEPDAQVYASLLADLIQEHSPSIVLYGATPLGRELAPRVAVRTRAGLASECTILKINRRGLLAMTRPTYGGQVYSTVVCPSARPQMATVRPGVIGLEQPDPSRRAEVVRMEKEITLPASRPRVVDFIPADPRTIDLSEAEIVVAGGRGVGEARHWLLIEELADALGGSVGGTRMAVDAGWIPLARQIGQTGKTVSPRLFVSCGISGSIHHTAGMKDSRVIIAINTDRQAPIFRLADLGIVGDLRQVVPAITRRLRQVTEQSDEEV